MMTEIKQTSIAVVVTLIGAVLYDAPIANAFAWQQPIVPTERIAVTHHAAHTEWRTDNR